MRKISLLATFAASALFVAALSVPLAMAMSGASATPPGEIVHAVDLVPATVDITATPAGWDSGWLNQSVTVTVTSASDNTSVCAGIAYWLGSLDDTPSAIATATSGVATLTVSQEGTTVILGAAIDTSSNAVVTTSSALVRIDTTKPKISFRLATPLSSGWTSSTLVPLTINATDALSGVRDSIGYRVQNNGVTRPGQTMGVSQTTTLTGEGRYAVEATTTDYAGNASASTWTTFGVDATAPKTVWERRDFVGRARLNLQPTDALSGVKATYYRLDGDATQTASSLVVTMPADASAPQEHRITYWSSDVAGNVEMPSASSTDVTFTITPDHDAPTTTLLGNGAVVSTTSSWFPGQVAIGLSATDTPLGSGIESTWYQLGDGPVTTYTAPFFLSGVGDVTIRYWSEDRNEILETPKSTILHFDSGSPWSMPDVLDTYRPTVRVLLYARDSLSGIGSISWWIDDQVARTTATAPGVPALTTTATCSIAGTHYLNYVVSDLAGNRESTQTIAIHVKRNTAFTMTTKSTTLKNTTMPARASISGYLKDGSLPVPGRGVFLQYSSTSTFSKSAFANTYTDSKGHFAFSASMYAKTYYRLIYSGDEHYFNTKSSTIVLLPRAYLSTPKASSTSQHAYRYFTVSGTLKPAHSRTAKMRIQKYLLVSGKPVYKGYTSATVTSKGTYSTYKASIKLTRGTWRLYAYMPADSGHATTKSAKYITIKVSR